MGWGGVGCNTDTKLVEGKSQFLRWLSGGHISRWTKIIFVEIYPVVERKP